MLGNTDYAWGSLSKTLHWVIVMMIAVEVPVGFLMTATYGTALQHPDVVPLHDVLAQIHHTNGFFILFLFGVRLAWRSRNTVPQLGTGLSRSRRRIARLNHWILYALLLVIPLSGWAALSALADSAEFGKSHIWFFGSDALIPPILPRLAFDDPYGYSLFARAHRYLLIAGAVVLGTHVLAAFWHHLWRKDGLLLRMWPGTGSRATSDTRLPSPDESE